ncbi:type II toxin-antitoxin system RelE/ParE family toxin [Bifidobacterium sp. ESL0704]|uniref:type II toxin-antitoxin system RelE/ParE family toxin n=1 Tax=Bifidobacterium sp. ESL0704 TaxID=2983219 RepID=UPI0023F61B0D|nr:type II toxin-antitoxin system RelE/ParE family toxin [Bifidobacterium sp. ESL0704]WEV52911.1 type II toxin-antitoxin system RelE/ParE family toxin [Bifidobacterium sp. ESL0704]
MTAKNQSGSYQVAILPVALRDVEQVVTYIAESLENRSAALRYADNFYAAFESLAQLPYSRPLYEAPGTLTHEYRRESVGNYEIFYWIEEARRQVTVARVIYARRDLSKQLK